MNKFRLAIDNETWEEWREWEELSDRVPTRARYYAYIKAKQDFFRSAEASLRSNNKC